MTTRRIKVVNREETAANEREVLDRAIAEYGYLPGIVRIMASDPEVRAHTRAIYSRLHLRPDSPLSRVQREMIATVVNGLVGGAP